MIWIAAAIVVVTFVVLRLLSAPGPDGGRPAATMRFTLPLPDGTTSIEGAQFAASPDGTQVVLAARDADGQPHLWLRAFRSIEWRKLARTQGAGLPFWSPDSRSIGFFAERTLRRIDVASGLTETLCNAPSGRGGTWSPTGVIVFAPGAGGPLFRVAASGGTPQPLTEIDKTRGETAHAWPVFLPDADNLLFVVSATGAEGHGSTAGLSIVSMRSGRRQLLVPGGGRGTFAAGYLVFERGSQLLARRFDPNRREFRDDPWPIGGADDVGDPLRAGAAFSVSGNGPLIHGLGEHHQGHLMWLDRSGRILSAVGEAANYQGFSLSPDGRTVAVIRRDGGDGASGIWLVEPDRRRAVRLTEGSSQDSSPVWSPDGRHVTFASNRDGADNLYNASTVGDKAEVVYRSDETKRPKSWSSDGRLLIYSTESADTGADLWVLPQIADRKPQPLLRGRFNESDGRFSPDGRWIAYVSDESGRDEVYLRSFPQPDRRWPISSGGGSHPRFRSDGRELFFLAAGQLMSVDLAGDPERQPGMPRPLFAVRAAVEYEVSRDGQRFLVTMPAGDDARTDLEVVVNWTLELHR